MATMKGRKHEGATERMVALFAEIQNPKRAKTVIANRLRRGETIPGIGQPLYPAGDPRATVLMQLAESAGNTTERRLIQAITEGVSELLPDFPNLDFGLVALARAYRLPESAPFVLFTLGRTVGWIAHALEQYALDEIIRPRAIYTGQAPSRQ
jgi:citrate synthase